ncbi:MAG TPA: pitrilysin family protein, partial [Candidatus Omnitrophota bacterium]|nr:pitrilysin family protein [Candidatus Omnitrophota bacterium]
TRSADKIKESVEGVGGSLNAFTGEEYTCFLAKVAHRHFDDVFDVLADMVKNATITQKDLTKERAVILEEIKMTQDQPAQLVEEVLSEMMWPGHALGRPLAGSHETVSGLSRQDLITYRDRHYQPNLITVAAAGAVTREKVTRAAQKHFGSIKNIAEKKMDPFIGLQSRPKVKVRYKKTEQTHLSIGIHAVHKSHPDEYALDILSVVLGGNMSSRLFNEVREKRGLAYDIGSYVKKYQETGAFGVDAGVDNKKIGEAVRIILKELHKTVQKEVTGPEFMRAKEFYLGQMELGLENSMNHMLWIGESAVSLGRCRTPEEVLRAVRKVSIADLRRVARNVFKPEHLNLAVVGPHREALESDLSRALSSSF